MIRYKIANLEKAILDYLYWNNGIDSIDNFAGMRWNTQELVGLENNTLLNKYLKIFGNRALCRRVDLLLEFIHA